MDTAKTHGRLVAYETYTITWLETISIVTCYFGGTAAMMGAKWALLGAAHAPVTAFELAVLLTWGHSVELMGHTATQWTPHHVPQRAALELLGIDLRVPHVRATSNYRGEGAM